MSWLIKDPDLVAPGEATEILYVITVNDLIDRYDHRHDPDQGGDGATWEGLGPEVKEELKRQAGTYLENFNSMSNQVRVRTVRRRWGTPPGWTYYWADALDDAIAAVEGEH